MDLLTKLPFVINLHTQKNFDQGEFAAQACPFLDLGRFAEEMLKEKHPERERTSALKEKRTCIYAADIHRDAVRIAQILQPSPNDPRRTWTMYLGQAWKIQDALTTMGTEKA